MYNPESNMLKNPTWEEYQEKLRLKSIKVNQRNCFHKDNPGKANYCRWCGIGLKSKLYKEYFYMTLLFGGLVIVYWLLRFV